jgi:hypothetical protein
VLNENAGSSIQVSDGMTGKAEMWLPTMKCGAYGVFFFDMPSWLRGAPAQAAPPGLLKVQA